jgi:hypothetical protein
MKKIENWPRIIFIAGVIALIIGAIDPLEGSLIIALGSLLLAISTHISSDRHREQFRLFAWMICIGVGAIWYVSSLGGYDPKNEWWWWVAIAPYPLGWIATIVLLLVRKFSKAKQPVSV